MSTRPRGRAVEEVGARGKWIPNVLAVGGVVLLFSFLAKVSSSSTPSAPAPTTPSNVVPELKELIAAPETWSYDEMVHPMNGALLRMARIRADETLNFSAPYKGLNYPELRVRISSKAPPSVMLEVMKGQFLCHDCKVSVRFDGGKEFYVDGIRSADHSSTLLFLGSPKRILAGLQKAKVTRIQATFFRQGSPVMTFQTAGLALK